MWAEGNSESSEYDTCHHLSKKIQTLQQVLEPNDIASAMDELSKISASFFADVFDNLGFANYPIPPGKKTPRREKSEAWY